ncbi:MAG: hypothetical protein M0R80_28775 [Proteobacteria bacterium]|jgi:hypothetical protein|nr:hypothetical protein [Pseudomonadota bacterium]
MKQTIIILGNPIIVDSDRVAKVRQALKDGTPLNQVEKQFDWEDNREATTSGTTSQQG